MKHTPRISEAEFAVMKIAWEHHPITANEIVEKLSAPNGWNPKTVKTLISRLVKKGALKFEAIGKTYLYSPTVHKEECQAEEAESFLNRVFDGALVPMLAHFAKSRALSETEIKALRNILDREE